MAEQVDIFNTKLSLLSASHALCTPSRLAHGRCSAGALGCDLNCCTGSFPPSPSHVPFLLQKLLQSRSTGPLTCLASTSQHQPTCVHQLRRKGQGEPGFPSSQMSTEPARPMGVCQEGMDRGYPRVLPLMTMASAPEALRI